MDKNEKVLKYGQKFHSLVSTNQEGVFEYWAMILAAISLFILAIEKIPSIIRALITLFFDIHAYLS